MLRTLTRIPFKSISVGSKPIYTFSNDKNKKYKVIDNPAQISKLVFDEKGLCKIYEYQKGQYVLRKMVRYIAILTFINGLLFGMQMSKPIFGKINMVSFGMVTGLGYFMLSLLQVYSRRTVHRIHITNDFQTVYVEFFNAFWKPQTMSFHISQFQEPVPGFADFTRFELTRVGKIWINLPKNQFRNVQDYEQTLDHVLLGKHLTNLNIISMKKKH